VERVDEVLHCVVRADAVLDPDQDQVLFALGLIDRDVEQVDPRLPLAQRLAHLERDVAQRRRVDRGEYVPVDAAAEPGLGPPLARRGAEDDPDRLGDVLLVAGVRESAGRADPQRERPADAEMLAVADRAHEMLTVALSNAEKPRRLTAVSTKAWSPFSVAR